MESANKINTMAASAVSEDEFKKVANKVSFITIVQNVLLSVFKLFAGIFAHSNAMISDAVHSASDVFSTIIVIIGVKLASKESDKEHPYGHERLECVAAIVLSIVLLYTGIKIGSQAVKDIIGGNYQSLQKPGMLALVAAVVSIVTKDNVLVHKTLCEEDRFKRTYGRCMASPIRCAVIGRRACRYRWCDDGIPGYGFHCKYCYLCIHS